MYKISIEVSFHNHNEFVTKQSLDLGNAGISARKILSLNSCGTIGYFLGLPHIAYTRLKLPDFAEP
jgi:hypothetical protein